MAIPSYDFKIKPRSKMAICSLGVGEKHTIALKLMKPTVEYYGKLHNIDTHFFTENYVGGDEPKRNKIFLMHNLFKYYEIVMWMDSDTIIVRPEEDIRKEIQTSHSVYMGTHFGRNPIWPNSGVIVAKKGKDTKDLMEAIWTYKRRPGPFWDQQAIFHLLGYEHRGHTIQRYHGPTKYTKIIGTLDNKWNYRIHGKDVVKHPVIIHFSAYNWEERHRLMKQKLHAFKEKYGI